MRITKFGHACVRIEHDGTTVVIDPGMFTDLEALDGADAVLITHEHPDHYLPAHLEATDVAIFTIDAVAARIREEAPGVTERVSVVSPEERFDVRGLPVRAVGELHAVIHPELPRFHNSGYVLTLGDQRVYHPGDAQPGHPRPHLHRAGADHPGRADGPLPPAGGADLHPPRRRRGSGLGPPAWALSAPLSVDDFPRYVEK